MDTKEILKNLMRPPLKDPRTCYFYSRRIMKELWPEAEHIILKDPEYAYWYIKSMIKHDSVGPRLMLALQAYLMNRRGK